MIHNFSTLVDRSSENRNIITKSLIEENDEFSNSENHVTNSYNILTLVLSSSDNVGELTSRTSCSSLS